MKTTFALDRRILAGAAAGLVAVELLLFSAGWLAGAQPAMPSTTAPSLRVAPPPRRVVSPPAPQPATAVAYRAPRREPRDLVSRLAARLRTIAAPQSPPYSSLLRAAADRHALPPALVEAVARVESDFNPRCISHKGAMGLMQVIPATGARFGVKSHELLIPERNVAAGTAYLAWLLDRYDGNVDLALAAYNAGEGAVDRYRGIPPYRETQQYVRKVRAALAKIEAREGRS